MMIIPKDNDKLCCFEYVCTELHEEILKYCLVDKQIQVLFVCKYWKEVTKNLRSYNQVTFDLLVDQAGVSKIVGVVKKLFPDTYNFYAKLFEKSTNKRPDSIPELVSHVRLFEDICLIDFTLNFPEYPLFKNEQNESLSTLKSFHQEANNRKKLFTSLEFQEKIANKPLMDLTPEKKFLFPESEMNLYDNLYQKPPTLYLLSSEIKNFSHLSSLILDNNALQFLPDSIRKLQFLKTLSVQNNYLKVLTPAIAKCKELTTLDVGNNLLQEIPREIEALHSLSNLWLNDNQFTNLSGLVALKINSLKLLSLSNNPLQTIAGISQFASLKTLYLKNSTDLKIPIEQINQLINLQTIEITLKQWLSDPGLQLLGENENVDIKVDMDPLQNII